MPTTTRRLAAALLAASMLVGTAAGCASDDEGDEGTDTEQTENDDATNGDSGDSGDSEDITDLGDLDEELGDLDETLGLDGECFEFAAAYATLSLSLLGALDESAAEELSTEIEGLDAAVPSELEDEWETVRDAYQDWIEVVGEEGIMSDAAAEASEALDQGDVADANEAISTWIDENCGATG